MSTIRDQWTAGKGIPDTLVIDGHIHIGNWPDSATFASVDEAVEESVRYMDSHDIDLACSQGGGYMYPTTDYRLGNDFLLEVWKRMPDRLVPFANANPNDDAGAVAVELERMHDAGVRGIKLINDY